MPGLTVTEKEHWKGRIAKRIDKKIETVMAAEPHLIDRVGREARQRALESLGLAEFQRELDTLAEQQEKAKKQELRLQRAMLARVRNVDVDDLEEGYYYAHQHSDVTGAINRRKVVHEDELLAESEIGQQILQLRAERENLLDTIWLATSATQLKQLWSKVAELLGESPTQLERDALAIVPVED